jgi:MYXO-CTERM domain-containing protein
MKHSFSGSGVLSAIALAACSMLLWAVPSRALAQRVVMPRLNGTACPGNVEVCINTNETQEGGAGDIDALATATVAQETFSPQCQLTFRVVARGAGYKSTFGWYQVVRDAMGAPQAPALSGLHVFLGCDDAVGAEKTLTIPPGVQEIGFFLANDAYNCVATQPDPLGPTLTAQPQNLFLSQGAFNSDGDGRVHLLVWQSHANPEAFYFGWEDQSGGGDNDFDDLLTFVTGIECSGGGEPCLAAGQGVCADGVQQCRDGALTCVPTQTARAETCNALDDDCNGATDDGDLCPPFQLCIRGNCEPRCSAGEFPCLGDDECVDGVCMDPACVAVQCPARSLCDQGNCVQACGGVVCPFGQGCRDGVCVDVCAGVACDEGTACEARASADGKTVIGVCSSCDCRGCGDGNSCVAHLCLADACMGVLCGAGEHCDAGQCVPNCAGAVCPIGELCSAGACVPDLSVMSAGGSGSVEQPVLIGLEQPTTPGADETLPNGIGVDMGGGGASGIASEAGDVPPPSVGCGCTLPRARGSRGAALLSLVGLAAFFARRRRARSSSSFEGAQR